MPHFTLHFILHSHFRLHVFHILLYISFYIHISDYIFFTFYFTFLFTFTFQITFFSHFTLHFFLHSHFRLHFFHILHYISFYIHILDYICFTLYFTFLFTFTFRITFSEHFFCIWNIFTKPTFYMDSEYLTVAFSSLFVEIATMGRHFGPLIRNPYIPVIYHIPRRAYTWNLRYSTLEADVVPSLVTSCTATALLAKAAHGGDGQMSSKGLGAPARVDIDSSEVLHFMSPSPSPELAKKSRGPVKLKQSVSG